MQATWSNGWLHYEMHYLRWLQCIVIELLLTMNRYILYMIVHVKPITFYSFYNTNASLNSKHFLQCGRRCCGTTACNCRCIESFCRSGFLAYGSDSECQKSLPWPAEKLACVAAWGEMYPSSPSWCTWGSVLSSGLDQTYMPLGQCLHSVFVIQLSILQLKLLGLFAYHSPPILSAFRRVCGGSKIAVCLLNQLLISLFRIHDWRNITPFSWLYTLKSPW